VRRSSVILRGGEIGSSVCADMRPVGAFVFSGPVVLGGVAALAGLCMNQLIELLESPSGSDNNASESQCVACDGTGFIDCMCTRWDMSAAQSRTVQCGKCAGSRKERCPRCGGRGLMIHNMRPQELLARVRRDPSSNGSDTWSSRFLSPTPSSPSAVCPAILPRAARGYGFPRR